VDVTLLYFDGCSNWQLTDKRLREALARAGRNSVRVQHRLVTTAEQAEAAGFRGSPTVLVNGQDPFADLDAPAGMLCRVFRTEAGLTGAPDRRAAARGSVVRLPGRRSTATKERVTCGCCGRDRPRAGAHELGDTPGVYVCWRCALWMAARIVRRG
jgi:hypothetical protein